MKKLIAGTLALVLIIVTIRFKPKNKFSLDGIWKIIEVQTVKADGTFTSSFPTESQVIFTRTHYSFCWTSHTSSVRSWQMSDSMKLIRLNQTIINSGSY